MAETPLIPAPLDPREQAVLDQLLLIRTDLILLKKDRTTYIKSSVVMPLYDNVMTQVKILSEVRHGQPHVENRGGTTFAILFDKDEKTNNMLSS